MKKYEIIKEHKEFDNIINTGKYNKGSYFVIYYKDNNINRNRFGIAVSKKTGTAVIRNRLKRVTREILNKYKNMFKNNYDYIIIVKRNALNTSFNVLEDDILNIIKGD